MMFSNFPKTRPPLPPRIERIYAEHYKENRDGRSHAASLAQKMEGWMHKKVAHDVAGQSSPPVTLEIGAGTLNQLHYEPPCSAYDIVEPFKDLYAGSPLLDRIRNAYSDIREIPLEDKYERITSVASFEHICNLPDVVAYGGLLLSPSGALRISVPSEGTVLWTLGWKLTTGIEFRLRHGLDYGQLMRHEHVNTAKEIEGVLRYFFRDVHTDFFGLSRPLSFYQYHTCKGPDARRCREYLRIAG